MDIPKLVAKARLWYHANALDVNNVLNQLHIMKDDTAERLNKYHAMRIFNDVLPRIYNKSPEELFDIVKRKEDKQS